MSICQEPRQASPSVSRGLGPTSAPTANLTALLRAPIARGTGLQPGPSPPLCALFDFHGSFPPTLQLEHLSYPSVLCCLLPTSLLPTLYREQVGL